jgi:hypothetical protein
MKIDSVLNMLLLSDKKTDCAALYRLLVHSEESGQTEHPDRRGEQKKVRPFGSIDGVRLLPCHSCGVKYRIAFDPGCRRCTPVFVV